MVRQKSQGTRGGEIVVSPVLSGPGIRVQQADPDSVDSNNRTSKA